MWVREWYRIKAVKLDDGSHDTWLCKVGGVEECKCNRVRWDRRQGSC